MLLPVELILLIFETLAHEKDWQTLKNCSLVSRPFLNEARKFLFEVITLRLCGDPNPILIRDVERRIYGLCNLFERKYEVRIYVKKLEVLDSYPVYDSQWITQQQCLPRLLDMLHYVRYFTFGCEVGYLQWSFFSPQLQASLMALLHSPSIKFLSLCNLGSMPIGALNTSVRYLSLNNVTTIMDPFTTDDSWAMYPPPSRNHKLWYVNIRSLSIHTTNTAWTVIRSHADQLKLIKWRCWEDIQATSSSLPGGMDLGKLPSLKKFAIRMSFGKNGRDLTGFSQMLEAISYPNNMHTLDMSILFPYHQYPHEANDIYRHVFWERLADILLKIEYRTIRKVIMELTVHERTYLLPNGSRGNSTLEFQNQMNKTLRRLLKMSSLTFKLKVHGFRLGVNS